VDNSARGPLGPWTTRTVDNSTRRLLGPWITRPVGQLGPWTTRSVGQLGIGTNAISTKEYLVVVKYIR
jgi:hypothetical protein